MTSFGQCRDALHVTLLGQISFASKEQQPEHRTKYNLPTLSTVFVYQNTPSIQSQPSRATRLQYSVVP